MSDAAGPALELAGLERNYGERPALDGVTVTLEPGRTLAVFGSNGAGKTTLLRVLGAELPREAWKVRGKVGLLGHEPLLYPQLSARENLTLHARLHRVGEERVGELLAAVRLERRGDDPVRDLSRGMVQRAAAARAVLHDPPLLLLDEPRANLDPAAADLLEPLIGRASGRARVLVTHDVAGGLAECDSALGLRGGRQVFAGKASEEQVRELYG